MSELTYEETVKIYDIQRKMKIVKNVVTACCADKDANLSYLTGVANNPNSISIVHSIRYYTGLDLKTITTHLNKYLQKPPPRRTFDMCLQKCSNTDDKKTWDERLRDFILSAYLFGAIKLPTIAMLKMRHDIFHKKCAIEDVKARLENSFYSEQKIEGTSKVIIFERPEKTNERCKYLEAMDYYRSSNLDIIYVSRNDIEPIGTYFWEYIVVSPKEGVLGTFKPSMTKEKNKMKELEKWMILDILPQLTSPSVIVLGDSIQMPEPMKLPTIYSLKKDMIKWLTVNNIVHRPTMHRAELYELIRKTKRHFPDIIYNFDTLFNAKGHKVLRQPKGVTCLNYFQKVWTQVKIYACGLKKLPKNYFAKEIVNRKPEQWQELNDKLIIIERKLYADDIALEDIIDKILTLGKYSPSAKKIFDACDDAPKDDKMLDMIEL